MENVNYDDFFNPQVELKEDTPTTTTEYKPSAQKGTNNVYQAIIRFIPWWKDPKYGSIRDKWSCWLVDPLTERGRNVDCPSSIGQPSLLQDMYFKCRNSDNAVLRSKMDIFSRRHVYSSLIQIIKDSHNPDLEGKIFIWKFGIKIFEKIDSELKPVIGEKHDPFDLLEGKAFALVITKVKGFNNYDQSKFVDRKIPLIIPDDNGKLIPITADIDRKMVFDFVKENSPVLEDCDFKPWTNDTLEYVNNIIIQATGESATISNYTSVVNSKDENVDNVENVEKPTSTKSSSGIVSQELNLDDLEEEKLESLDFLKLSSSDTEGITGDLDEALKGL